MKWLKMENRERTSKGIFNKLNTHIGFQNLKLDIKTYYKGAMLVLCYIVVMDFLLGGMCPMLLVTGLPCPGCGMTRAGMYLGIFHFDLAWQMNPMSYPVAIFVVYSVICRYFIGCRVKGFRILIIILSFMMLAVYGYRMMVEFLPNLQLQLNNQEYIPQNTPMYYSKESLSYMFFKLLKLKVI